MTTPFIRLLCFALLLLLAQLAGSAAHAAQPSASAGTLDLRDWDFVHDGAVLLKGEWQFVPGRLVGGSDPWPADGEVRRAPAAWKSAREFAYGAGTYRLRVNCTADDPLALAVPFEPTAMALFVNGRLLARQGQPGLTRHTHVPGMHRQTVSVPGAACPLDIRVQVSNFELYRAGMVRALTLGTPEHLHAQRESDVARNVVAVSAAVVVGIFGLFSYSAWRRDASGAVLGLFCLSLAAYLGLSADGAFETWLTGLDFAGRQRLAFANTFFLWAMHPPLVHTLFPRQSRRTTAVALTAFCGTGCLVSLVLPLEVFVRSGPLAWGAWFVVVGYFVVVQARASMAGERAARVTLTAVLVLLATIAHDLLGDSHIYVGKLMPYGLTAVVVALALLLAERFGRALAAEELRAAEQGQRADLLVRATKAGVLDREIATGAMRASERYREMLGLPAACDAWELPPLESLVHPQDRTKVAELLRQQTQERGGTGLRRWDGEDFRMVRTDGKLVWVRMEAITICGDNGAPLRHICTLIDISELKTVEERLRQAQAQLLAQARRAGMAQIATNVLHNVGNVLTSVNVSAHLLTQRLETSRCGRLDDVARLLDDEVACLSRGTPAGDKLRLLPTYLRDLAAALETERREMREEIARLTTSVDHVKNVVAMQQRYAGTEGMLEPTRIVDLVEDALHMQEDALSASGVSVIREFGATATLPLDRTRVMQILLNLVDNAREAMEDVRGARRLRITVRQAPDEITLSVADTGRGIPPENLGKIFAHGFTTRPGGYGFGLHTCAIAAREMGGQLLVYSAGEGMGATFTLVIRPQRATTAPTTEAVPAV